MRSAKGYRIAIGILSLVIAIEGAVIIYLLSKPLKKKAFPVVPVKGRIAIVLDDWGYGLHNLHILDQVRYPVTMAVLPNLRYSQLVCRQLHKRGFEIILHLPMEPHGKVDLEKNTIMACSSEQAIRDILRQGLKSVPYAHGVSNHMGSRATEDLRIMTTLFQELKKRHLYFLDSFVSPKSVGLSLSHKIHLGFLQRDIFLDSENNPEYIKEQIYKLKDQASLYGYSVGIGHDRKATLEALAKTMPELEKEGYKFVFLSDLVR